MHKEHETFLGQLDVIVPPPELTAVILARVFTEQQRIARIRLALFGFVAVGSLFAFIPVIHYAGGEFSRSGFMDYFTLLFSDGGSVLLYWKEFSLSLVESLPVLSLAAVFATLLVFLESLQLLAKNIRMAFLSTRLV